MTKEHEIAQKHIWLLFLYGVFAFFVFCIVLFPREEAVRQGLHFLSQKLNCTLSAKDLRVVFPGRLELKALTITGKDSRAEAFPYLTIDTLQVRPKLSQLFFKKLAILFNLKLYQGTIEGVANFDLLRPGHLQEFSCFGHGIRLAHLKHIRDALNVNMNGELTGQANVKMEKNDIQTLSGNYHFDVAPGDIQIMSFPGFTFQQIKGEGSLSQGRVKIQSMRIQGDDLQAMVTGDLQLRQNLATSYLRARVNLNIGQEMKKKLGPLASFLPKQDKGGIQLNIKGNLNNLSFIPL
ncbi:MAG: type II secretion system protein GspN [bacterium]